MADFKGLERQYDDIKQLGSRSVGLMTEFKTEAGRPIYISHDGEIVSEKSITFPYKGKYVNVPSIHDGIEYSEFELAKLLDEKKIKPTSTHKSLELATKAAEKRSPSLMSEDTARAVEAKYWKEMTRRKATADQISGDQSTQLVTPDAKAERQLDDLQRIQEDDFLDLAGDGEKQEKLDAYMSTITDEDKSGITSYLDKSNPRINSIEGDEAMAQGRARRDGEDYTVTAFSAGGVLKDEGGTVDPVSGNDVPPGALQEEVRDDIPAQLSEGEFVLPADVVRYIGLENLMELRNKAKQGLAKMEAMGQMGNSDEATMEDDDEYESEIDDMIDSFDPNDPETLQFADGGVVYAANGADITSSTQQTYAYDPIKNIYNPSVNVQSYPLATQQPQYTAGYFPQSVYTPPALQPTGGQKVYSPGVGVGGGVSELRQYQGPNGEMLSILFLNGVPQQEIPKGYTRFKPAEPAKPEVAQPTVQPQSDGGGEGADDSARAQQEAQQKQQYEGWVTTMNQLSELDPEFAKTWNESSKNPKNKSEGFWGGLKDFVKGGGIAGLVGDALELNSASTEAYKNVAEKYGLDIGKYENSFSFFGLDKYNESSLVNDAMATKSVAESIAKSSGGELTPEQTIANIVRSDIQLDANKDGRITEAEKRKAEEALFMTDVDIEDLIAEQRKYDEINRREMEDYFLGDPSRDFDVDRQTEAVIDELAGSKTSRSELDTAVRDIAAATPGASTGDISVTSVSPAGDVNVDVNGDGIADRRVTTTTDPATGQKTTNSYNFNIDRTNDDYDASGKQTVSGATKDMKEFGFDEGDTGDTGASDGTYCCTKMVEHGLWDNRKELAKMHNWHMKQPQWWRDGYDIWGKLLANTLLKNNSPFWTSVMQECYEYHINKKKLSLKSALGNGIMYSGVAVCGLVASLCGRHVNEL